MKTGLEKSEGATHLSYDGTTFQWVFRVDHFTRWGASDDEDDDEEPAEKMEEDQSLELAQSKPNDVDGESLDESQPVSHAAMIAQHEIKKGSLS